MLVKLFGPIIQLDAMSVRSVVLVNLSNHQLLVHPPFPIISVISVTPTVLANTSKNSMLPNLPVSVMQVILSFVIPLVSLFLILLVIQLVKPARKLTDVNRERPLERLVNNKNNCQYDFAKPFSAVIILMMSIYFNELAFLFFIQ